MRAITHVISEFRDVCGGASELADEAEEELDIIEESVRTLLTENKDLIYSIKALEDLSVLLSKKH
jgi:hypothetical protein